MLKLLRFLQPFRGSVLLVFGLVFLQTLADLSLPTLMARIVDRGVVGGDVGYIVGIGGLMLLVAGAGVACSVAASFLAAKTAMAFGRSLRSTVFARVENFSLNEFDTIGTATLIVRTTNDITQVQQVLFLMLRLLTMAPMMLIGGVIMAVSLDASLALILLVAVPVLVLAIALIQSRAIPLFRQMQLRLDRLNQVLREGLMGIRVIRAFNRSGYEQRRFAEANRELTEVSIRVNKLMAVMMPLVMVVMNFTTIGIIWFGGIRIDQGVMPVGALMAFLQYAMWIMFSLIMGSVILSFIPRASVSAGRINEVLEKEPSISDPQQSQPAGPKRGEVEFREVSFCYPGAELPALCEISFRAGPGEVTAIIGGTGSGKTTLVNLILRFHDVSAGQVLVDGVDVRAMAQEALRAKIGYVPQQTVLFSGTIAQNLRYGKANASEEEIRRAAATAQALEFISGMEQGFETVVAQGGKNLSGGQKQRLAIARALVRRPEIYIFDDSFSALDFKTDARLRRALRGETSTATVFMVAQRVSNVIEADRIIVLDNGRMAAMGSHRELMNCCPVYREIVRSQLAEEELA